MNSSVCVDASLVLKLVLPEADSDRAHRLWRSWLETDTEVLAPEHLALKATSVIRTHVYRGLISPETGRRAFDALHAQAMTLIPSGPLNVRPGSWPNSLGAPQPMTLIIWHWQRHWAASYGRPTGVWSTP